MNKILKKILNTLESNGYEAYIIGGFVRDLMLGIDSFDVDICTNALPKDLKRIFPQASTKNLGGIDFKIKSYHFEITTYREEIKYHNRKPIVFNYIENFEDDLKRRDFTINCLAMNRKGEIIDCLNGLSDLQASRLRMIDDIETKLQEDPLRIMRAIRFATTLGFNIEQTLFKALKKHHQAVLSLSKTRIREELDKILLSKNVKNGLNLLDEIGILKDLKITYQDIYPVKNIEAMYAQITISHGLDYTKVEKENIAKLKKILKEGEITNLTIYHYGLYLNLIAGEILEINKKLINKMYKDLPIHEKKDINIKVLYLIKILDKKYISKLSLIIEELEQLILNGKLKNKKSYIIKYLKEKHLIK